MRCVKRQVLTNDVQADLDRRQAATDAACHAPGFDAQAVWSAARRTCTVESVHETLRAMMGDRERCMYCLDSHGTDIEHFWPKAPYPERMFRWLNLLLCCTECGRFKGKQFPLSAAGMPMLVDPTTENPWEHLDFDPKTGNIVPRFDLAANDYSAKGRETVRVLNLDRREAMAKGYKRTLRRIAGVCDEALNDAHPDPAALMFRLREADDHGLLAWCFKGSGANDYPFSELRAKHPAVWSACVAAVEEFGA